VSRCNNTEKLEIHHKRRDGGNDIENAQVLCQSCHENTSTYGKEGKSPLAFSNETKEKALVRANNQCECEKKDCHTVDEKTKTLIKSISNLKY